jgi:hypothetical protein
MPNVEGMTNDRVATARGISFRPSGFAIDLSFVIRISSLGMTRAPFRTTCEPCNASLYQTLVVRRVGTEVAKRGRL